ncbi:unnamed protein product [Rhodiola kirilowii]
MLPRSATAGVLHHLPPIVRSTLLSSVAIKFCPLPPRRNLTTFAASSSLSPVRTRVEIASNSSTTRKMPVRCYSSTADNAEGSSTTTRANSRERNIQHLLVKEQDTALIVQLIQRLGNGEDFDNLVDQYSICPSKTDSGIIGWVTKDQLDTEFAKVAFEAPLEKVVRCKTRLGWHLLRVLGERDAPIKDINPAELYQKMQDPLFYEEAQLIDVREPDEVSKASLPRFQVFPLRQFGTWGPDITTKLDPSKDTYVLCHHGIRSLQVAKWLQLQGFQSIYNVVGGIHAYANDVDPSIPTY